MTYCHQLPVVQINPSLSIRPENTRLPERDWVFVPNKTYYIQMSGTEGGGTTSYHKYKIRHYTTPVLHNYHFRTRISSKPYANIIIDYAFPCHGKIPGDKNLSSSFIISFHFYFIFGFPCLSYFLRE